MTPKRDDRRKAAVEKQIDENLRRAFEQDTTEDIPDRFLALLEQLRQQSDPFPKATTRDGGR
ncbi:NepR family anti-sigma factor [Paracoccus sp. S3-43]|uniref:NepR family anti-sigma factor n=1 Tax=Paracoccus sp. S3-43 TaxID=3030011 RepID=UPI0023B020FE|nr:NepR family anti-sigma factor [Paracoccus sp. S3-43]WEF24468.1 NepR family anti-sigma factor [Paracoccus sp. S3-43]